MHLDRATLLAVAAGLLLGVTPLLAQQTRFHGEVRPRYELRDPAGTGGVDEFTSMRVRLALEATLDTELAVFVQVQDVRLWGEETSPLRDYRADNIDLHQGYLRFEPARLDWLTVTAGRMEARFGGERLIGPVDWTQQGQSFDGVRLDVERGRASLAVLGYRIGDDSAPAVQDDSELYGVYGTVTDLGWGDVELYWLYDRTEGATDSDVHSVGARYVFAAPGGLEGRIEGTFQTGTRGSTDVSAFLLGARVGRALLDERVGVTLWYDYVSGDDPSTPEIEVFHTLYATNHRFYGLADLFLDVPAHTGGSGLQDMAVKLAWRPRDDVSVGAEAHAFRAAERRALSGSRLAEEIDLTLRYRYSQYLTATTGFSYVLQQPPLAEIGRLSEDLSWFYVMLSAAF